MRRRLHLVPVALMLVIAVIQASVAGPTSLSPWKGGGFGMFATIDHARVITVDGTTVSDEATANQASKRGLQELAGELDQSAILYRPVFDRDTNRLTWQEITRWP